MSRRRRQSPFDVLLEMVVYIIYSLIYVLMRLIMFLFDVITFYTSKYKVKSSHKLLSTLFDKGHYGEFKLYKKLLRKFHKDQVLTNLYLDSQNTEKTEVDMVAVTKKGIYVFEMKNYGGYIYGSYKDEYWTQVLNRFSKNTFYNPFRQNYAHTKAIEDYLELEQSRITPVVVFSNRSKLSKVDSGDKYLFQLNDVHKFIKSQYKKKPDIFTEDEVISMILKLEKATLASDEVKAKHIEDIEELIKTE